MGSDIWLLIFMNYLLLSMPNGAGEKAGADQAGVVEWYGPGTGQALGNVVFHAYTIPSKTIHS